MKCVRFHANRNFFPFYGFVILIYTENRCGGRPSLDDVIYLECHIHANSTLDVKFIDEKIKLQCT